MTQKLIFTDGLKHADLLSDDPSVWTYLSGGRQTLSDEYYSKVAAAFRAFNLKANTVGGMPFCLYRGKTEFDSSATWENKVGFLPNPAELFRLDTLSYMTSNTVYNVRTTDALGYKQRGLYHAVASTFTPETDPATGALVRILRQVGARQEYYEPEDKKLFRAWRLDHTTEVLPSPNTEARAIMHAAGVMYYADFWVQNFYRRGGIKPTLIAMKGILHKDVKEEKEQGWDSFMRGIGRFTHRITRIFNADSMDIQPFGSGVDDMKDNKIYEQALANIAMGVGMPLSLLMANSANYATAKEEKATWYENDIIPLCNWLAYEYNRQIFEPIGLRLEFHPETLDPQQEDETERAQAMMQYASVIEKVQTAELFFGLASTLGLELSDELHEAIEAYYEDKAKKQEEMQAQMGQAGVVLGPDGKPIPVQQPADGEQKPGEKPMPGKPMGDKPMMDKEEEDPEEEKKPAPAKWTPSLDMLEEMKKWRQKAHARHKRAESLDFEWKPAALPTDVFEQIKLQLLRATNEAEINAAFEIDAPAPAPAQEEPGELKALADSLNKMAEAIFLTKQTVSEKG